jgi:N-acetylmuramic acid 6-phosphate etherase
MSTETGLGTPGPRQTPAARSSERKPPTEQANPAAANLDRLSALEIARLINTEDARVAAAVERALPEVARAIEMTAAALAAGGRLLYVGTGTSGRIAAMDAAECPPTFGTDPRLVQYVVAGGEKALGSAQEADEDSRALGRRDLMRKRPTRHDVVVGVSAGGRTPYTLAALECARQRGAHTVGVTSNPDAPLVSAVELAIVAEVGAEVVAGSTRMKAGTAQKMILNMLSTGVMARLGYVYGNLMVKAHASNGKLRERGLAVLQTAAEVDRARAEKALEAAAMSVPAALVMLKAEVGRAEALRRLKLTQGHVRQAITWNAGRRKPTGGR